MESFPNLNTDSINNLIDIVNHTADFILAGYKNEVADGHRKQLPSLRELTDITMEFLNFGYADEDGAIYINIPHPILTEFEYKIVEALVISFFLNYVLEG